MEEKRSLSVDDMEKVSGGNSKTVIVSYVIIRSGPGKNYSNVGELKSGDTVNFTGEISYNDSENTSWFLISAPTYGWVPKNVLGN